MKAVIIISFATVFLCSIVKNETRKIEEYTRQIRLSSYSFNNGEYVGSCKKVRVVRDLMTNIKIAGEDGTFNYLYESKQK